MSIGTGLLYQSGHSLGYGGPVSLLLAFLAMGSVLYSVLVRRNATFALTHL
jgi:amino acid permease